MLSYPDNSSPKHRIGDENGIAILEAAILLIVFLVLIISGATLYDYTTANRSLQKILHRNLHDTEILPTSLSKDGELKPHLDESAIQQALLSMVETTKDEIEKIAWASGNGTADYSLEAAYSIIRVDPKTGRSQGFIGTPIRWSRTVGVLSPNDGITKFEDRFLELENQTKQNGSNLHAILQGEGTYMPWVVLVGLKAAIETDSELTNWAFNRIGLSPSINDGLVTVLRGGIKL